MRSTTITLSLFAIALLGCDGVTSTTDAGPARDASSDAGVASDAGAAPDGGAADGGPTDDAGTSALVMPTLENTGPAAGSPCVELAFADVQADTTYTGRCLTVTSDRDFPANVTLVDSVVQGAAGGLTCFHLLRVRWEGGIFVRHRPGFECEGTIRDTSIVNPYGQALRPACTDASGNQNTSSDRCLSGWTVEDSYLASPVPGMPDQHLEAMQALWDTGGFTFRNVNFFMAGPPNDTQTGDINWHGSDSTFTDCWFTGGAGFRVYAAGMNLSFIRPRIAASAGSFGFWYPPHVPALNPGLRVECPMLPDGTPIADIAGSVCP